MRRRELVERGQRQHRLDLALEDDGEHGDAARQRIEERRADGNRVLRDVGHDDAALVDRALADEALAERKARRVRLVRRVGVAREHAQVHRAFVGHLVDEALVRVDQRRQLGQQHPADRGEVALALQHAGEPREVGLEPVLLGVAVRGQPQVVDHRVDVVFQIGHLAARLDLDRAREVALGHGGGDFGNGADLVGQVRRQQVHVAGQVLPCSRRARHVGLAAEAPFHADFARDRRHLVGEDRERLGHVVDRVGQRRDFALRLHEQVLLEVAFRHGGHDLDDAAHLLGEVRRHHVDGVGQVLPRAAHAWHLRLAAELAFGAHFARDARDFRRERVQLVDHRVDRVLELEDFAADVDGDLARQVAARDGRRHFGDVAHLRGEVGGEQVDVVGQVLPRAGDARHDGLAAELAFGAHLARHADHFGRERAQLLDHRVHRLLDEQDLAAHVDGDLARQVAAGDGRRDLGDAAHLRGQVARHEVDVVGQVLPRAAHARHLRLAAELALGADFARHPRDFRRERVQLVDHRVDRVLELEDFALHVHGDLARQVAARDGRRHFRDVAHLRGQVARHRVDVVGQALPRARHARHLRLAAELALGADLARHARDFRRERVQLVDHRVDRVLELEHFAAARRPRSSSTGRRWRSPWSRRRCCAPAW